MDRFFDVRAQGPQSRSNLTLLGGSPQGLKIGGDRFGVKPRIFSRWDMRLAITAETNCEQVAVASLETG